MAIFPLSDTKDAQHIGLTSRTLESGLLNGFVLVYFRCPFSFDIMW